MNDMPNNTRVCHITTVHGPFDDRIFLKECISLKKAGYEVFLVCKIESDRTCEGVQLRSFRPSTSRPARILFDVWKAAFKALKTKSKIIHLHDPELLQTTWLFRLFGKKVIFDSHENVPGQILSKTWIGSLTKRKIISSLYAGYENFAILFCSGVISVTEEITNRFPKNKRQLIRNFPRLDLVRSATPAQATKTKPVVIYAGGLSRIRGIKECIDAMEKLNGEAELWLLGPWSDEQYKKECESLSGWKYCRYHGNILPDEVFNWYKHADIGIALLYPETNYLHSLPIKAFEYMAAGLPIIMSDFPYWQKHFSEAALFVDPKDSAGIASTIDQLLKNSTWRKELSEIAARTAELKYSWENESLQLIQFYKRIIRGN